MRALIIAGALALSASSISIAEAPEAKLVLLREGSEKSPSWFPIARP